LTFDPATQTFTIGDLAKGAEDIVINYTVTVNGLGSYNNTATVTGSHEDPGQLDLQERPTIVTLTDSDSASVSVSAPSRPPHTPDKPVVVPEEPTPAGPVIVPVIDEPIPAAPLPKTGGLDPGFLYGLGALLATGGFVIRRRKDK
jgi:LPXTG-motif cell wall-anchored protein